MPELNDNSVKQYLSTALRIASHPIRREILKISKNLIWNINEIEIYDEENKILSFDNSNKSLFYIIKNNDLFNSLNNNLKKNNNFKKIKIKNKLFYKKILKSNKYDLIINCDERNEIHKKMFNQKILKDLLSGCPPVISSLVKQLAYRLSQCDQEIQSLKKKI